MPRLARALTALAFAALPGCSNTVGRVVLTPLTGVRDVVDAPLVTLANAFEYWAERSDPVPVPQAGVSVGTYGVSPSLGINLSYYIFKPFSWIFGGVDYLVCRSLWPDFPAGISPWKTKDETWGSLYFPNTRELWRDEAKEPAPPAEP